MDFHIAIAQFLQYIRAEKRYSVHTATAYQNDLSQFEKYIAQTYQESKIENIQTAYIKSWMAALKNTHHDTAKTIRRKISTLKSFYKFHLKEQSVQQTPVNAIILPKINKRLPVFISETETEQLIERSFSMEDWNDRNAQIIMHLLYETGMRLSELIGIETKNIDFGNQQLKVLGKGNKERIIPLSLDLTATISDYLHAKNNIADADNSLLLVLRNGKKLYPKYVYNTIKKMLGDVTTLRKKSPHVLRHTFATQLMNNGTDLNAVKELLGHASLASTQVYTHNSIEKLKEVFQQAHPKA